MTSNTRHIPPWVPESARRYLVHTETGISIRALARDAGCHASTVLRQIRNFETRREDPLIDDVLRHLGKRILHVSESGSATKERQMTAMRDTITADDSLSEDRLRREGRRALRRLSEAQSILVVAVSMDRAVIVREVADKDPVRIGIVEKPVAEAMALKGWIACQSAGRIMRYSITRAGREALAHLLADVGDDEDTDGFAEAPARFDHTRPAARSGRRKRYGLTETPLLGLARRKDRDGAPFLPDDLVRVGERLREDFELAQMGPHITQNWDHFLTGAGQSGGFTGRDGDSSAAARQRVSLALRDLGPGLGDVALRCCCYLEGLERIEQRLGWSARSGKIVLRIALQRLKRHYEAQGGAGDLIG